MLLPQAHLHVHAEAPPVGCTTEICLTVDTPDGTFTLSSSNTGTYNATVHWGDGTQSTITSYDDPDLFHTYPGPGTYDVVVDGPYGALYQWDRGDKDKIVDVIGVGYEMQSAVNGFWGVSAVGVGGKFGPQISSAVNCFKFCRELTEIRDAVFSDAVNITSIRETFYYCDKLTNIPSDLFGVKNNSVDMRSTFRYCPALNDLPAGLLDGFVHSGCNFSSMFRNSGLVNVPANLLDNTSSSNMLDMFAVNSLTQQSVDNILVSLDSTGTTDGTISLAGGSNAAPGPTGIAARDNLVAKGWTVATN